MPKAIFPFHQPRKKRSEQKLDVTEIDLAKVIFWRGQLKQPEIQYVFRSQATIRVIIFNGMFKITFKSRETLQKQPKR